MKTEPPKYRITDKTALDGKRWFVVQRYDYVHETWADGIYINGLLVAEAIKETQRATHTPGPWEADNFRVWAGTEEAEANARLIAAAPEMLQALRDALQICQIAKQYFPKSIKNSDKFDLCNIEENSIKKAIAKATGTL